MSLDILGLVMLGSLFAAIMLGFPISFTLVSLAMIFGYIGLEGRVFNLLTYQVFHTMTDQILAAVTLFLLMGYILEQAGLMTRFFKGFQLLFGSMRGSLYLGTIIAAVMFAAATGIVGASVTIVGLMAAPHMMKSGYSPRISAGTIAAGGTLGILIPPSVMLVVIGPTLGVSIMQLFAGAILPGLLLAGLFLVFTMVLSYFKPEIGPPLSVEQRSGSVGYALRELLMGIIPPAGLILATLGSILTGFATPTEGAAIGAAGAFLIVILHGRFNLKLLKGALYRTAQSASMILFLIASANFFAAVFSRFGSPQFIANFLLQLPVSPTGLLLIVLGFIFLLGWPLGCWVPIVVIFVPIFAPIMADLGISMLVFGILVAVTLQTAWLSPPVALSAYFLSAVVPEWKLEDIYIGMFPFMMLQLVGVVILVLFPKIITFLPALMYGQ